MAALAGCLAPPDGENVGVDFDLVLIYHIPLVPYLS